MTSTVHLPSSSCKHTPLLSSRIFADHIEIEEVHTRGITLLPSVLSAILTAVKPHCLTLYRRQSLQVANWPGVTVEKKEGHTTYEGQDYTLIDLPGIYSLTSYTMEEKVSRECILSDEVDVIIDVADASSLERNLYLTLQLIELGKPVVLALNMMDIVEERGMEIDLHRLPEMLGIPVIPVISARKENRAFHINARRCTSQRCITSGSSDPSSSGTAQQAPA